MRLSALFIGCLGLMILYRYICKYLTLGRGIIVLVLLAACALTPASFTMSLGAAKLSAAQGDSASQLLTVIPQGSFAGAVDLTLAVTDSSGQAASGITLKLKTITVAGSTPVVTPVTLSVAADVPLGSYDVTLTATSADLSRKARFLLEVKLPQPGITTFTAATYTLSSSGGSLTLSWQGTHVSRYTLSVSPDSGVAVAGSTYSSPVTFDASTTSVQATLPAPGASSAISYTFTLKAFGTAGTNPATKQLAVTVGTGSLSLTVSGIPSGVVTPPTITLKDDNGDTVASEQANGAFALTNLEPGTYHLAAPAFDDQGYHYTATVSPVTVNISAGVTAQARVSYEAAANLDVTLTVPTGVTPRVILEDADGSPVETLTASTTLMDLSPGDYTLAAQSVLSGGASYAPTPATQALTLKAAATSSATVEYSQSFTGLNQPYGVAFDPDTHDLYVTNSGNNTITVYDVQGRPISTSGAFPNLSKPAGITYDEATHYLYVTNNGNNTVTVYDAQGKRIPMPGSFTGLVVGPKDIAYDSGTDNLYVSSSYGNAINVYDGQGKHVTVSGSFPGLNYPKGIAYNPDAEIFYVANYTAINAYNSEGAKAYLVGAFPQVDQPVGIAYDGEEQYLYITNGNGAITVYDSQGRQITPSGTFTGLNQPAGIAYVSDTHYLYVADSGSDALTVYDAQGQQVAP